LLSPLSLSDIPNHEFRANVVAVLVDDRRLRVRAKLPWRREGLLSARARTCGKAIIGIRTAKSIGPVEIAVRFAAD
jgi:hypothetical protein